MVTKETFDAFETARLSGNYNMVMDASIVMRNYFITKKDYLYILDHYSELKEKFYGNS